MKDPRIPVKYPNLDKLLEPLDDDEGWREPLDLLEEKKMCRAAAEDGLFRVRAFVDENIDDIARTFWTFPTSDAEELFEILRKKFWAESRFK